MDRAGFLEPPWGARLDPEVVLRAVPESATVAGMFLSPVAEAAAAHKVHLASARDRYLPFKFYPLREHARLLVEACQVLYPGVHLRGALRKLGRGAPAALLSSTVGKVTLGSVTSVPDAIEALCKTYPVNLRPCQAEVLERSAQHCLVHLSDIYFFLDCHHVGVLEGTMRHAGVKGQVQLRTHGPFSADMLCTWPTVG